jgi:UDP-2-acetamido-3-amino-2,3-dideoxy-glucuronate N-acetyltransferase
MVLRKSLPKMAVLGTGYWGKNLVRNFYNIGCLKLVADTNPDTLKAITDAYPGVIGVNSLSDILMDPEVKGVAIATPAVMHAKNTIDALSAGKDVLVEKPMALSMKDGISMTNLAKSKGLILMVDHLMNRHPAIVHLKEMIRNGDFGRILHISSRRLNLGKFRTEENALWSLGSHSIASIVNLLGAIPLKVKAFEGAYITEGVEDFAECDLLFPAGVTAHISLSWLNPFKEVKLTVIGTEKMAVFDDCLALEDKLLVYPHKVKWEGLMPTPVPAPFEKVTLTDAEPLKELCLAFADAVKTREEPSDCHSKEALTVLGSLIALDKSFKKGKPIVPKTPDSIQFRDPIKEVFIHPLARVDSGVKVGKGTKIWHFSHILDGSTIGTNTNIGQNVVIGPRVKVGNGVKIQNNVSVYEGVELEDDTFCGPSMVFTNVINPRSFIKRMKEIRPTVVKRGASIGANATIVCGHTIGEYSFVAAGSVVTRDVPPYALVKGNPAKRSAWICKCGIKLPSELKCPACGNTYQETDGILSPTGENKQ